MKRWSQRAKIFWCRRRMTRIILPSSPLYRLSALHACQRLRMQVRLHNLSPAWTCTTCVNVPQGDWESPGPLTKWRLPGPMHGIKMGVEDISQRLQTSICHNASSFQWSHCFPCSGRVSLGVTGGNRLAAVSWSSLLTFTRFYKLDVTSLGLAHSVQCVGSSVDMPHPGGAGGQSSK